MAGSTIITSALRNTLASLEKAGQGNTADVSARSNIRPEQASASGTRQIKDITDISIRPESLTAKAQELQKRLDKIDQSIAILNDAGVAGASVEEALRSANRVVGEAIQNLARGAATGQKPDPAVVADFAKRFNETISKIDEVVASQDKYDVRILRGDALETSFTGIANTALVTQGSDITRSGLGLEDVDFSSVSSLAAASDVIRSSVDGVRGLITAIDIDVREIETKQDFARGTVEALQAGVADLDNLGQSEEGANLLAKQASLLIAGSDDALIAEAQQELLNLF